MEAEAKADEYHEMYHKSLLLINKDSSNNSLLRKENESLNKQLQRLSQNLDDINERYK